MASPHASSFICLPFSDNPDVVNAYTVYFAVCVGSALIGVIGAVLFLSQVLRNANYQAGTASSQRRILIVLAISDLFADIGEADCGTVNSPAVEGPAALARGWPARQYINHSAEVGLHCAEHYCRAALISAANLPR